MSTRRHPFLNTYLFDMEERIQFLQTLRRMRRAGGEPLLLCCCYIDGLGKWIYMPEEIDTHERFVRVVREHGGDKYLPLVHPMQMRRFLGRRVRRGQKVYAPLLKSIEPLLIGKTELMTEDEFLAQAQRLVNAQQFVKLKANVWRGTLASFAYNDLRAPAVHELSGDCGGIYGGTTYRGEEVPFINYEVLSRVLLRIFETARKLAAEEEALVPRP